MHEVKSLLTERSREETRGVERTSEKKGGNTTVQKAGVKIKRKSGK